MSELMKDYVIKLFGKNINLPPENVVNSLTIETDDVREQKHKYLEKSTSQDSKDVSRGVSKRNKQDIDCTINPTKQASTSFRTIDDLNTPYMDKDSISQEKTLKMPDKIVPCPRCNSMETKFCYYNNYNVNQPRYLCKKCQRFWTSGGTIRNVPIGSGRRKSKNPFLPNYGHIIVSDTMNVMQSHVLGPNGILIFNSPMSYSILGKHSRDGTMLMPPNFRKEDLSSEKIRDEQHVFVPKTLRIIDDPNEAAKSSIWSTIGIENRTIDSCKGKSFFKSFDQWKGDRNSNMDSASLVLQANPAALSRLFNFNESAN